MKKKILIISANYYQNISINLVKGIEKILLNKTNKKKYYIKKLNVPGVFEIPVVISKNIKKFDAFICIGCVIKGKTPHFDYISRTTIDAIMYLAITSKKPIGNGIITCFNKKQATERSNLKNKKNKGKEAAKAVLDVLNLYE